MGKWTNETVLDQLLEAVRDGSVLMLFNTVQPADRTAALSDALASVTMSPSDFTFANASPNGRQATIAAKNNIAVTTSGNVTHVSLISGTDLIYVTTTPLKELTAGDNILSQSWSIRVADPS